MITLLFFCIYLLLFVEYKLQLPHKVKDYFLNQRGIIMSLDKTLTKSKQLTLSAFSIALLAMSGSQMASAGVNESIENALKFGQDDAKYGQVKFDLRYRYEQDDSKTAGIDKGDASTVRLRLGYLTPEFHGLQGYAEYETNQDFGANTYNSTRNGKGGYETIIDPQEHELNQLWLSYKGLADTEVKVGRQRIKIDNDRFIGNVGWRQMESTYDAVLVTNKSLANTTVKVGYINQSQTIHSFVQAMQTPFVNIAYNFEGYGKLTGYTYLLDNNENHNKSNQTYGFSFAGKTKVTDDVKAVYRAEYAYQKDYEQNPNQYEVDYFHIIGGADVYGLTAKAGIEVILIDQNMEAAEKGKEYSTKILDKQLSKKRTTEGKKEKLLSLITPTTDYSLLKGADLIVEAAGGDVVPDLARKTFESGKDLMVISIGALIDYPDIIELAKKYGCKLYAPSGAIAGLDGIKSASIGTLGLISENHLQLFLIPDNVILNKKQILYQFL